MMEGRRRNFPKALGLAVNIRGVVSGVLGVAARAARVHAVRGDLEDASAGPRCDPGEKVGEQGIDPDRAFDLVGPVVFLSSAMSSYVTGATLAVDGGYLAV